ncbi:MAG: MgtC/SapB family protein [Firmicutes bacterium]|nr:MgtC/SapB family protein [Bacillota bacterium]
MEISYWEIALRLILAVLFGGLVGFERESHNRPAGFRTHILVCTGSSLIMMVSAYGFMNEFGPGLDVDPGRIAAQVVTGIGFLGAGTILQQRGSIRGLTTAASIWVVSGIGLATGIGFYAGAAMATVLVLISLLYLGKVDRKILSKRRIKILQIRAIDQPGLLSRVSAVISDLKLDIRKAYLRAHEFDQTVQMEVVEIEFALVAPLNLQEDALFNRLASLSGILEIIWQGEDVPVYKADNEG